VENQATNNHSQSVANVLEPQVISPGAFVLHVPAPHLQFLSTVEASATLALNLLAPQTAMSSADLPMESESLGEQPTAHSDNSRSISSPATMNSEVAQKTWRIDVVDKSFHESAGPHFDVVPPPILPPDTTDDSAGFDYEPTTIAELRPESDPRSLPSEHEPHVALHENDYLASLDNELSSPEPAIEPRVSELTVLEMDSSPATLEQTTDQVPAAKDPTGEVDAFENEDSQADMDVLRPFTPHWEVDHFEWPATCQRLDIEMKQGLVSLCATLQDRAKLGKKILLVTSHGRREGVTSLALCIAHQMATIVERTMLMDANLLNPDAARQLGVRTRSGLERVVRGAAACEDIAVCSQHDHFTLLPLRRVLGRSAADTQIRHPATSIIKLLPHADFLLVDLGPIGSAKPALQSLATNLPLFSAIVVQDVRHTTDDQAYLAQKELADIGIESLGIVQNFTGPAPARRANSA